jgi:hypothetical protein
MGWDSGGSMGSSPARMCRGRSGFASCVRCFGRRRLETGAVLKGNFVGRERSNGRRSARGFGKRAPDAPTVGISTDHVAGYHLARSWRVHEAVQSNSQAFLPGPYLDHKSRVVGRRLFGFHSAYIYTGAFYMIFQRLVLFSTA